MELEQCLQNLPNRSSQRVCVGLSGGADSVVLLHLLAKLRDSGSIGRLTAVHVHHGLSQLADGWADFCQQYCRSLNVPLAVERVQVNARGKGVEAAARQARYACFARQDCDMLALAHHRNDQLETFFLAALRGGGLRALAAMPFERVWQTEQGSLKIVRPLLACSRQQIEDYAHAHELAFVSDESNTDTHFLRNWVRHEWLPQLAFRLPAYENQVLAAVETLQDELAVLDEVAAADEAQVCAAGYFSQQKWQALSAARRRQVLLRFVRHCGLGVPRRQSVQDFERVLLGAQSGMWQLTQGRAVLHCGRLMPLPDAERLNWKWLAHTFSGNLKTAAEQAGMCWQNADVTQFSGCIRAARRGDVLPLAEGGHKRVFDLLQEHGVPALLRPLWAVAADEFNHCVAVANVRSAAVLRGALLNCEPLRVFQAA